MGRISFILLLILPNLAFSFPSIPDASMTFPTYCHKDEADFKTIKYGNIAICNRNVSTHTKKLVYEAYNIPAEERKEYTIDHLVPLFIGGSNQITNLWPQHKTISTSSLEGATYSKLEKGTITYEEAISTVLSQKIH